MKRRKKGRKEKEKKKGKPDQYSVPFDPPDQRRRRQTELFSFDFNGLDQKTFLFPSKEKGKMR